MLTITRFPSFEQEKLLERRPISADLKRSIVETLERRHVVTTANIGFAEAGPTSAPLGNGTFQSAQDREWYGRPENSRHILNTAVLPTGLGKNQADASWQCDPGIPSS